ncbi:MAG: universal stress protein [Phycisphaerales bacterium]|nr:universal stress protein [Phycisphaerales bacterium]
MLRAAEDANVSMIVMGTQGRTGVARVLMGSVAEQVVRNASCPVLVVKRPKDIAAAI